MAEEQKKEVDVKKIIWISVMAVVGTLILGVAIAFLIRMSQFTSFYDSYYKIRIKHPKSWIVGKDIAGTIVTFIAPKENALDNFNENLNISVSDLPPEGMTLAQFSKIATSQTEAVFRGHLKVIESREIDFAGFPAYSYVIRTAEEPILQLGFVWFFKENRAYVITYAVQMIWYKKYFGKFNYMLDSFAIGVK